jgi:hypothetical protein
MINNLGRNRNGYKKIRFCSERAKRDGLKYFWIESCSINSIELQTAINSMFQYYKNAAKCYVYLSDVSTADHSPWEAAFRKGRWSTRGWTLQELLAPQSVEFFSQDGKLHGNKDSLR